MKLIAQCNGAQAVLLEPRDWKLWRDIQIQTALKVCAEPDTAEEFRKSPNLYWESVMRYENPDRILILQNEQAVGCATIDTDGGTAMIETIDILPEYQGQGLGNFAYSACVVFSQSLGYPEVQVDIKNDNERSTKAALRNGFLKAAQSEQRRLDGTSLIRYTRPLEPVSESLDLCAPE